MTLPVLALLLGACTPGQGREASPVPYVTPSALLPEPPPSSSPKPASERQAALAPPEGKGGRDPGDINGDGFADLVFPMPHDHWSPDLAIVYGSRRGLNPATRTMVASTYVEFTPDMSTADLDGDGFADILAHGRPAKALRKPDVPYILWGGPKGVDPGAEPTLLANPFTALRLMDEGTTGDFDGDGNGDLAIPVGAPTASGISATHLALLHGPFTRAGVARRHDVLPAPEGGPQGLIAGRIGRHRATDLLKRVSGIEGQYAPWLLRGGPAGLSRTPLTLNEGGTAALGDFDGDGRDDAVVADDGGRIGEPGYETEPPWVDGVMTVSFGGPGRAPQVFRNIRFARNLVAGDYDGDGDDDLAVDLGQNGEPGRVEVFHGGGGGLRRGGKAIQRFAPTRGPEGQKLSRENRRTHLYAAADYDGDGRDELALSWLSSTSIEGADRGLTMWWITDGTRDETVFGTGAW